VNKYIIQEVSCATPYGVDIWEPWCRTPKAIFLDRKGMFWTILHRNERKRM